MPHHSRSRLLLLPSAIIALIVLPCRSFQPARSAIPRSTTWTRTGVVECYGLADPNAGDQSGPERTSRPPSVLCVGETLYDSLPDAIFLGGATTNVANHLASMGTTAAVVTCVGADRLGKEAFRRLEARGVDTRYVQEHPSLLTGMVTASIDANGDAEYAFDTPAAWDGIEATEELRDLLCDFAGVTVIGTLASRLGVEQGATSASAILELRNLARDDSVVLDVNLRPPWYDPASVLALSRGGGDSNIASKQLALVKLNEEELPIVEEWCGLRPSDALAGNELKLRMTALASSLHARRVCVTRGGDGAALFCGDADAFAERGGYSCVAEPGFDTVGAGDSFLAALIRSLLLEHEPAEQALDRACALGGYVAKCRGAVPIHGKAPHELREIFSFA